MQSLEERPGRELPREGSSEVYSGLQECLRRPNIPALDGLRALSVLLVVLAHIEVPGIPDLHGVMMFFALSGFLITWLSLKEQEQTGTVSLKNFYIRRALRIFPAFYVFWCVHVALFLLSRANPPWAQYFSAFFYFSNYYIALVHPAHMQVAHTWSLAMEEQFYLLWPVIFVLNRKNLARLKTLLMTVIVCVWIYRVVLRLGFGVSSVYLHGAFEARCDHLAIGCLFAVVLRSGGWQRFWSVVCARAIYPAITLALLCVSIYADGVFTPQYRLLIGMSLDPILLAILMIQLVYQSEKGVTAAWRWLNAGPVRYVGRISYSVYLYHGIGGNLALRLGAPLALKATASFIMDCGLGSISYYLIERPCLRLKERFVSKKVPSPVVSQAAP